MTNLGRLNTSNFFCKCGMAARDTPHSCIESKLNNAPSGLWVGFVTMVVVVMVAVALWLTVVGK